MIEEKLEIASKDLRNKWQIPSVGCGKIYTANFHKWISGPTPWKQLVTENFTKFGKGLWNFFKKLIKTIDEKEKKIMKFAMGCRKKKSWNLL